MTVSVADRVSHRLPRPVSCDACGSSNVYLQKRGLMGLRSYKQWDLIWHCLDCDALVGCHEGTDIPLGRMADRGTRAARSEAHTVFDRVWKKGYLTRPAAYVWLSETLMLPLENAHIGMLNREQCATVIKEAEDLIHRRRHGKHWSQDKRKKRRR